LLKLLTGSCVSRKRPIPFHLLLFPYIGPRNINEQRSDWGGQFKVKETWASVSLLENYEKCAIIECYYYYYY
jgi:hypothetical protein